MQNSTTAIAGPAHQLMVRALHAAPTGDPDDFWEIDRVKVGRGFSSVTFANTTRLNGVPVYQRYYTPGPYDALAYGADSPLAAPRSTYSVYTEILGLDDEHPMVDCLDAITKLHPNVDLEAMAFGKVDIWSPDGEGALYLEFEDEDVEAAFAFADSLRDREVND